MRLTADTSRFRRNLLRRSTILGVALLLLAFAAKTFYFIWSNLQIGNIWFNDFLAIFDCCRFPIGHLASEIYDRSVLDAYQDALAAPHHYPCPYPPSFLLLMAPIGWIDFYWSYAFWMLATFAFYLAVSWCRGSARPASFLLLVAPATVATFSFGQTGFLTSTLMVGGCRFLGSRPILSGIFFGLLSIKPQLGVLVPIALVSARSWMTLAAAGTTVLALVFASSAAFGWSMWSLWLAQLLTHADWAATGQAQQMPTIIANLTFVGLDLPVARVIQIAVAIVVAGIIWACFHRGPTNLASSALLVGTFLATPYAFVYDMPMVTNAILAVIRDDKQRHRRMSMPEALILLSLLFLPVVMMETWRPRAARSIPLILMFGLILWRIFGNRLGNARPETTAGIRQEEMGQI